MSLYTQNAVTLEQLTAIPVPEYTRSWRPVPYRDAIDYVKLAAQRQLGLPVASESYGLSKDGQQMFGVITLDTGDNAQGLALGVRGSYNKTLANGLVAGAQLFVCDNLMFSGDAFKIVRKNTINVWADFRALVSSHIQDALGHYRNVIAQGEAMKAVPLPLARGYAVLGVALGEQVLTPTQANVAYGDWREPRHPEFAERSLWGLYQAVTEGLKKGAPGRLADRHTAAHGFFTGLAPRLGSGPRPLACLPLAPAARDL